MSMVVNQWMGELAKITDKIMLKQKHQPFNVFLKSQTNDDDVRIAEQAESGTGLVMEGGKTGSALMKVTATENELCEETVFWLMDRFAPC
ncbi:hypothetical protein CTI12_AA017460 [Artemisia annua]|uniref:Uncharacterized protein n=1 Tax=Artemisia annua TaxID=35608 RepID=A0A2U1Q8B7_ARTAN|nr:hypothetical protein CTI12_AA017460 [Artemisia annua]